MLFASQTFKALLRKALYVVVMWAMVFSSVQSQTLTPVTQTDFAIKIQSSDKKAARLTGLQTASWNFDTLICDAPLNDARRIYLYPSNDPTMRIDGRILSAQLRGVNASEFRIVFPTVFPAPISAALGGAVIQLEFYTSTIDMRRTAQLVLVTEDINGIPSDSVVFNLTAIRARRSIQLIQQQFDFGSVPPNTASTTSFWWLRNTGTVPITWEFSPDFNPFFTILDTKPAPTKNAISQKWTTKVNPGDSINLTVRFNGDAAGQNRIANFNPTETDCRLSTDFKFIASTAQNPPNITVRNVVQGVDKPVMQDIFLGNFACPNTDAPFKDTTLKIYTSGQIPLIVNRVTFDHPDFQIISPQTLASQRPDTITFNTSRDITIRYTPRTPSVLDIFATMTLFSNSTTGTPSGSTTVTFQVRKDSIRLEASRLSVDFGSVTRNGTVPAQTLVIRNTGTLPQGIPPINDPNFTATFSPTQIQAGDSVVVTLRAVNTSQAGVVSGTWVIRDNCNNIIQIPLRLAINRPNPTIGLAVPVSFGRLVCSSDTVITLPISNTGNDANDLVITSLSIVGQSNGAFSFVQQPPNQISIPSGQSRSVQIRFRPNRTGAITDVLRIVSNAEGTPTFDAPLNGSKDSVSFRLSRTAVSFVNIFPSAQVSDTLTVINTGTVPITWGATSYTIANPFSIQIIPPITPVGGSSQVRVNFLGSVNDASATGTLADTCGRAQMINVSATILRPYISATPAVSFGTLTCELSASSQLIIKNPGGQDLVVTAITSNSPTFSADTRLLPVRIRGGGSDSALIPLTFTPSTTTLGADNAIIRITSNAANAVSGTTTTVSGIKNVVRFEFVKRFNSDLPNLVSRSLGNVPPNTAVSDTLTLRNTGNLPISWQTPYYSLDSLFTITSVSPNPTPPGATAVMTARYNGLACPDSKITANGIPVLQNYGFRCDSTARVTLSAQTLPATARLWTDSIAANISDSVALPIRLRNPQYLREAGVTGFSFVLRYDFSTLVPLDNPRGTIVGTSRLQPVTLMLPTTIPADSVLGRVRFQATLGSTSGTLISIDSLRAIGTSGASCIIFDNTALQGKFTLGGICLEGGMRLVTKSTSATVLAQSKPNPASDIATIDFSLLERGLTTITVYSVMGEAVLQAMAERLEPGAYSFDMDVSRLPSGVYFYVLQTPTDRKTRRMEVIR